MEVFLFGVTVLAFAVLFIAYLERRRSHSRKFTFYDGSEVEATFITDSIIGKIFLGRGYVAFAIGRFVFVKGIGLSPENYIHEARHVLQWKENGFFKFIWRYLTEHLKHGYKCNRFEEDARAAAGQPLRCEIY